MKKKIYTFTVLFLIMNLSYANDLYTEFLSIYNSYESRNTTYYYGQKLLEYSADENLLSETNAKSLVIDSNEISKIEQKNGPLYFLSTPAGYWIKNNKLKQPMKIAGNYKVMDIQMQDLLKLDFENDFQLEEATETEVLLKRTNKKSTYSFITLSKNGKDYVAEIFDSKMQKIKTIRYCASILNDKPVFTTIQIYNEFIEAGMHYDYVTLLQKEAKASKTLFNPLYMDELIKILDAL